MHVNNMFLIVQPNIQNIAEKPKEAHGACLDRCRWLPGQKLAFDRAQLPCWMPAKIRPALNSMPMLSSFLRPAPAKSTKLATKVCPADALARQTRADIQTDP